MIPLPANAIHEGLGRTELYDFAPDRLPTLRVHLVASGKPFSIHAPLLRSADSDHSPVAVFFLSEERAKREESFALAETTLGHAQALRAEYVVVHLNWKEDSEVLPLAERLAKEAGARLSRLSARYGIPIHLECGGYSGAFHRAEQFSALAREFPHLGLCLDVGHLWLIARQRERDFYRDLEVLAPHARSMHLWSARDLPTYRHHHHLPLHPDLRPADGWVDIPRALEIVLGARPAGALIYEYQWAPEEEARVRDTSTRACGSSSSPICWAGAKSAP